MSKIQIAQPISRALEDTTVEAREVDVTVVVCTYNRAQMLGNTLRSMLALNTSGRFRYEVVVVDNASDDSTPQVIRSWSAKARQRGLTLRGVCERQRGVAAARNRGIAEARGQWIAFCDDDQVADPDWLREMLSMAEERGLLVVGGAIRLRLPKSAPEPAPEIRRMMGESYGMDFKQPYTRNETPGTGNMMVHREVFRAVGSFDADLREAGEDTDLFRRIRAAGIDAWYTPRAIVRHVIPQYRLHFSYLRWNARRSGWCFADRDLKEWGKLLLALLLIARLGKATLIAAPQLLKARLAKDEQAAVGVCCNLWRTEGYARSALRWLLPWFPQAKFAAYVEFRAEREMFAPDAGD